jgi:ADP-heptose:LPS heptosyltransferase
MTYRQKILLDRTVGFLSAIFLAALARLVGKVLKRNHGIAYNPKSIVVAKLVGLGSIVYAGLLCRHLKKQYPETKLYFLTTKSCAALAERLYGVDEVLVVDDRGLFPMVSTNLRLLFRFWSIRPELYFDLEVYSSYASILANLSLARNRYGFYRKSAQFKKGLLTHCVFFNTHRRITEIYFELGRAAGIDSEMEQTPPIRVFTEDFKHLDKYLKKQGWEGKTLWVINPNASELSLERRWPNENWASYLKEASHLDPRAIFLLTGTRKEREYVQSIHSLLPEGIKNRVFNISGDLELGPLLALLKTARLIVTVDSGILHMAAALGRPTISLWGPGSPSHYAPVDKRHIVLYRPPYCSPCLYHADIPPCGGDNRCLKNISFEDVVSATKQIMAWEELNGK